VLFDEETFFDGKKITPDRELIAHMDELVERVSLDPSSIKNEEVLEVDDGVLCPERNWDSGSESNDDEEVLPFNEEEDKELVSWVEEGLITPPTEVNSERDCTFAAYIPFKTVVGSTPRRIIR
jgi:hypothetical protein